MRNTVKYTGKAVSIPGGLSIAAAVSVFSTIVMSAAVAYCLNKEKITWEQAGYWIMGVLFASAFLGCKSAVLTIKGQRFAVSIMSGFVYWGLLLCITALFFGGDFEAIWETGGIIAAGCGTAALLTLPKNRKTGKIVRHINR